MQANRKLGMVFFENLSPEMAQRIIAKYQIENPKVARMRKLNRPFFGNQFIDFAFEKNGKVFVPAPCYKGELPPVDMAKYEVKFPDGDVKLRDYQQSAFRRWIQADYGICCAPAGSGKTVIGCALMQYHSVRSMVIVSTLDLAKQWRSRCKQFLKIDAGLIGGGACEIGEQVTIATFQSAMKRPEVLTKMGLVIVDECHRAPCKTIRNVLNLCPAPFRYGCSATLKRSDGMDEAIRWLLGGVTSHVDRNFVDGHILPVTVKRIMTGEQFYSSDHNLLQENICLSYRRNELLAMSILNAVERGHNVIALGLRVEHLHEIKTLLDEYNLLEGKTAVITGSTPKKDRTEIIKAVGGKVKVLIATYQLAAEGLDIPCLSALVMLAPMGNETKIEQACGRVARPCERKLPPVAFDFVDDGGMVSNLGYKRLQVYKKLGFEVEREN